MIRRAARRVINGRPPEPDNDMLIREGRLTIGRHTYGTPKIHTWHTPDGRWMSARASIGAFCSIADRVEIFTGGQHRTDFVTSFPLRNRWDLPGRDASDEGLSKGDVVIGNDVWLCTGAWIMSGVTIGDGAVIAARSVVTRDVAPYTVVAGSPAKKVGRRFDDTTVARLLELRWWDWSDEKIRDEVDWLLSPPSF